MMTLVKRINKKIRLLNNRGKPIIFVITGNNCSGKTVIAKKLLQKIDFFQSINLGLASKIIRYFRPELKADELENFDGNTASEIFKKMVDFIIDSYKKTGVNLIIEGVQIDTERLSKNESVLGGVILEIKKEIAISRVQSPQTHFNRKIHSLKSVKYFPNNKFKVVNNEGNLERTFHEILDHINRLLDDKIRQNE